MQLATDRLPHGLPSYEAVTLDPDTQTAVYRDSLSSIIEAGKHGTNRTVGTATMSGGGDGQEGQRESQDDNATDYDDD